MWPFKKKQKLTEAAAGGVDPGEDQWRRLGDTDRDLTPLTHARMLEIAYHLYDRNPLAHRILELTRDFVVGDGITYTAEDDNVKTVLDDFWDDPVNDWDLKQYSKALELGLFGEQAYPVFVNKVNGKVRIGNLDPAQVKDVITDPENAEEVTHIVKSCKDSSEGKKLEVVHVDDESGLLTGETFWFAINKVSTAKRGRSDLLTLVDWLDGYEQMLFNQIDREALMNAFVWDVTLDGLNAEEIAAWLKKNPSPKPGSVRAHNEKIKWEAVVPDLRATDAKNRANTILKHILGSAGYPAHWFAEGSTTNKATAQEMGVPTLKRLKSRQRYFKYMIGFIFRFVIDQAIGHGTLPKTVNKNFSIDFPELVIKDILLAADAMNKIILATTMALNNRVISDDTAAKWISTASDLLGVEIDEKDEIKKAKENANSRDMAEAAQDYTNRTQPFSEAEISCMTKDETDKNFRGEITNDQALDIRVRAKLKLKGKERDL